MCDRRVEPQRLAPAHSRDRDPSALARYTSPLTQLTFATVGRNVYFMHADGSWEGDLRPDQVVIHEVLNLSLLRSRIDAGSRRDAALSGKVERRRGAMGSKPVLAGTRVPVETVKRYLDAGRTVEQILKSFPTLTAKDVEAVRLGAA